MEAPAAFYERDIEALKNAVVRLRAALTKIAGGGPMSRARDFENRETARRALHLPTKSDS